VVASRGVAPEAPEAMKFDQRLDVFPNPAKGDVIISYVPLSNERTTISIWDVQGKMISEYHYNQNEKGRISMQRISTASLQPGIYLVRYQNGGQTITKKLVIMK
jgi:hypothetical protein